MAYLKDTEAAQVVQMLLRDIWSRQEERWMNEHPEMYAKVHAEIEEVQKQYQFKEKDYSSVWVWQWEYSEAYHKVFDKYMKRERWANCGVKTMIGNLLDPEGTLDTAWKTCQDEAR